MSANSLRNLRSMPSGSEALPTLTEWRTLRTLRVGMIGEDIGLERGRVVGSGAWESLMEKLEENGETNRLALLVGEEAIEPSEGIRGGKVEFQKNFREFFG